MEMRLCLRPSGGALVATNKSRFVIIIRKQGASSEFAAKTTRLRLETIEDKCRWMGNC